MNIRTATSTDAARIGAIRVAAWRAAYGDFFPQQFLDNLDPTINLEALQTRLAGQDRCFSCLVSDIAGDISGYSVFGSPRYPAGESIVELWAINIDPASWSAGHGSALLQATLQASKAYGYLGIELWCITSNHRARRLYESAGFHLSGDSRINTQLTGVGFNEICYALTF